MMSDDNFYDNTPFEYGYTSREEIIANMNPLLKQLMRKNSGKSFYDIGCGCGRNLVYASMYADSLVGVDLSEKSLAFAKNFIKDSKLELIQGDNLDLPLDSEIADIVISDGVCHHTGDTIKAFSECVRILKPGGELYLAVYKKFRYYPFLYYVIGAPLRAVNKIKIGAYVIEKIFVSVHYLMYKIFKRNRLSKKETRNIFYDYFITPIATFQSKKDVFSWCLSSNCDVVNYERTLGNCHVFIIRKNA